MTSNLRFRALLPLAAIVLLILGCGVTYSTFITLAPEKPGEPDPQNLELARRILQERYNKYLEGKAEVRVDNETLQVGLSRETDIQGATALAAQPGKFILFESSEPIVVGSTVPIDTLVLFSNQDFASAQALPSNGPSGGWMVAFTMTSTASDRFAEFTGSHVGTYLVIALDGAVISSPVINSQITGGKGQLAGSFDESSARRLAALLASDPLPFTFVQVK